MQLDRHAFTAPGARTFHQQFCHAYFCRQAQLRGAVEEAAARRWGACAARLVSPPMAAEQPPGTRFAMLGTVVLTLPGRPSFLADYEAAVNPAGSGKEKKRRPLPPVPAAFADAARTTPGFAAYWRPDPDADVDPASASIEDDAGSCPLRYDVAAGVALGLVTGVVCALSGHWDPVHRGFAVDLAAGVALPGDVAPLPRPIGVAGVGALDAPGSGSDAPSAAWLLLASGPSGDMALLEQLLILAAQPGCAGLVVAGAIVRPHPDELALRERLLLSREADALMQHPPCVEAAACVDAVLASAFPAAATRTVVVPGTDDPSSCAWPQAPFHRCLFPAAARAGFRFASNPVRVTVGSGAVVGSSGANITDLVRYGLCPEDALRLVVRAACLAPTAPDTLPCYPAIDRDRFVLYRSGAGGDASGGAPPRVLFATNQPRFGCVTERGVLCVAVPPLADGAVRVRVAPDGTTTADLVPLTARP